MSSITWSLMHPTSVDTAYMEKIVEHAGNYDFDSFEICGAFASLQGGINGLAMLEPYPCAHAKLDRAKIAEQQEKMRRIIQLAHSINKPLYYWHREIMMPAGMLEDCPEMLDDCGEFDLLGDAFLNFIRYKIDNAFKVLPELDGIVLTLTEADFSVIHNSRPDRYPPDQVVCKIVSVFAEEHQKRGKHFILRSFGSIAQDYKDILVGAEQAAKTFHFDIETKITPYDFVPFLPPNPYLKALPNTGLDAECDCLGEFLGAGYLPACNVKNIYRYVQEGRSAGVQRYAIRLDRIGNNIFDSSHEINLYAYSRFIRDPEATVEQVMREYAEKHYPQCVEEMTAIQNSGLECVEHINFVAKNGTFHKFPIQPDFKWIKAGGILSVYRNDTDLHLHREQWAIRAGDRTPGRKAIIEEKLLACKLAAEGYEKLQKLCGRMSPAEFAKHDRAWGFAVKISKAVAEFSKCICAYFDDMDAMDAEHKTLNARIAESKLVYDSLLRDPSEPCPMIASCCDGAPLPGDNLDIVYFAPLRWLCEELANEFEAEFACREAMRKRDDVTDFIITGGIYDDVRVGRAMHASHAELKGGIPVRYAGNPVFPNGVISMELEAEDGDSLEITLAPGSTDSLIAEVNGAKALYRASSGRIVIGPLPAGKVSVNIGKTGCDYPEIVSAATFCK